MDKRQIFGIIGCFVLTFGVFAPLIRLPIVGSMNYFRNGEGYGTVVLMIAGISLVAILVRKYGWLWFTGLWSLGMIAFAFLNIQRKMAAIKNGRTTGLGDDPFRILTDIAVESIQMEWGWAVLVSGGLMLLITAGMKEKVGDQ